MNNSWNCYVCLSNFAPDIKKGYSCDRCNEGTICIQCLQSYIDGFEKCGICRNQIEIKNIQRQYIHRNEYSRHPHLFAFLSNIFLTSIGFVILFCDSLFYIITMKITNTQCSIARILLLYVSFCIKIFIMGFKNVLYSFVFTKSTKIIYFWALENIIFNCVAYIFFIRNPNCLTNLLYPYLLFCMSCLVLNYLLYYIEIKYCSRTVNNNFAHNVIQTIV